MAYVNGEKRESANSKSEKQKYSHTANKTKPINLSTKPKRGGIRL